MKIRGFLSIPILIIIAIITLVGSGSAVVIQQVAENRAEQDEKELDQSKLVIHNLLMRQHPALKNVLHCVLK